MPEFTFAWPWVFLLTPLPWFFYRWLPPTVTQHSALKTPFADQLEKLAEQPHKKSAYTVSRALVLLLIWLLLVTASARPQQQTLNSERPSRGNNLFLAIDISSSMLLKDMQHNGQSLSRMDTVKHFVQQLLEQRPGDHIGLIVFASQPYLQAPLTLDHLTLNQWLQDTQPGMAGENTAIGDAIGLALKSLPNEANTTLLLVTDGANNAGTMPPLTAARFAAQHGLRIYTLGIGSIEQPLATGTPHSQQLDETLLQAIAASTGGEYYRLQQPGQLESLLQVFDELQPGSQLIQQQHIIALYPYPLGTATLLIILLVLLSILRNLYHARQQQGG